MVDAIPKQRRLAIAFAALALIFAAFLVSGHPAQAVDNCNLAALKAIVSTGGTLDFNCATDTTITLDGQQTIANDLNLTNTGVGKLIISGATTYRIFYVNTGKSLSLTNLNLTNGYVTGSGDGYGAAIYNHNGTVTITNSSLSGNSASLGGGISNYMGVVTITNSSLYNNNSTNNGGAIMNFGTMPITNSSLYSNTSQVGGAIINWDTLTITNSSLYSNTSPSGGTIHNSSGTTKLQNSLLQGNSICDNASGSITDLGYNLEATTDSATCGFSGTSKTTTDAKLGTPGDNGGLTPTIALLAGSPAIDAIPVDQCVVSTDQRGTSRPQGTVGCDIGAYETTTGYATKLAFTTQPVGAKPGELLSTQPVVTVQDASGNPAATSYNGEVTVAIQSGTGATGAVLGGTLTVTAVNGIATFSDLTIDLAGTGYVLTASATDLTSADSEPFDVASDFVPVAHASDLVPQLRVSPDRVVSTNPENLVSFSFKVKNIGKGGAERIILSMPIPQGLDVGYLADGATSGVWVTQVTTATVTLALPKLEENQEASDTLLFRPNGSAVAGTQVEAHYSLKFDDATRDGKNLFSNSQSFVFGSANSDESVGAIQRGANVSAKSGESVSITQTGYLANELVALWYTAPSGTTVSLGTQRANADGVVTIVVNTAGVAAGDYAVVGYGNRSEMQVVNILTVTAS